MLLEELAYVRNVELEEYQAKQRALFATLFTFQTPVVPEVAIVNQTAFEFNAALVEEVPVISAYVPVDLFWNEYWLLLPFLATIHIILLDGVLVI